MDAKETVAIVIASVALVVSIGSATISYQSLTVAKRQADLAELQARPYVRYKPTFHESGHDALSITTVSENLSPVPAHVIYDELSTWVDGVSTGAFLYNRSGDVLYQHRSGASVLPVPKDIAKAAIAGKAKIMIGTCVVYSALSSSDRRQWEARALYSYVPKEDLPTSEYLREVTVEKSMDRCISKTLWSEWLETKQKPPH